MKVSDIVRDVRNWNSAAKVSDRHVRKSVEHVINMSRDGWPVDHITQSLRGIAGERFALANEPFVRFVLTRNG